MEDPLTMSATDAFHMLDPELPSFAYPDSYIDYQVPDFFNPSYLSGAHLTTAAGASTSYPSDEGPHSALTATSNSALDFPKPQDDLSHFFADSPFSSPTPHNQRFAPMKGQQQQQGFSPAWAGQEWSGNNNNNNNNINNNNTQASSSQQPLAILTSGFEPGDARTVVHHGQVTPGDSPEEMARSPGGPKGRAAASRRGSRKGKESISSTATTATTSSLASARSSASSPAEPPVKVKKPRKPRRSSKKTTTAEQAALKRETFLKRNREAAYKCRVKKKTQTEEVVERVKALGEDNRSKAAEVERLRREVEGLRGLLLPHYRVCGDERVVAYLDGLGSVGGAWGGARGSLGSLTGVEGLGLGSVNGGSRRGSGGSLSGSEEGGFNQGDEMGGADVDEEEEEREEERRRSEEMEDMFSGSGSGSGSGVGGSFDSGVTPVVEGMGGADGMGGLEGMELGGMDEVLGLGMDMAVGV